MNANGFADKRSLWIVEQIKIEFMEIYKGYEIFFDDCYYGMIAVRPVGCRDFNETQHVCSEAEAKAYVNSILRSKNKTETQNDSE